MNNALSILNHSREVSQRLSDDYSRFLYEKRCMFSLTGDYRYILDIINSLPQKKTVDEMMRKMVSVKDQLIVWGAGNDYGIMKRLYPEWEFICFVDRMEEKQKSGFAGKTVISPEAFYEKYSDCYVAVNSTGSFQEIAEDLRSHGVPEERIINLGEQYYSIYHKQYFDPDIMSYRPDEVFIDGGAFDGSTSRMFAKVTGGAYKKILAFEPGAENMGYFRYRDDREHLERMEVIQKGLWSSAATLHFADDGTQGARISESGGVSVETAAIDGLEIADEITFIKMDVEGAELEALKGARETILKNHPKLTICLYHKPEDIFEIPRYILSLSADYRFYLRHYQLSDCETLLYAV